ncbi:MAG TPA: hypothetical protein VGO06_05755 [Bosea sp. (in: a-proteobacteria)]|jgi:hypothetical protein|uniref:hypothetical protein n=1 Tax=Bosea sp. (in: a-proteobacteria) TaxID=1871050 RepID=UPI002E109C3B|nr:hypothetical protein [Bosea sp. (in: a-proteobacteria)]
MLHSDQLAHATALAMRIPAGYRPLDQAQAASFRAALQSDAGAVAQVALASFCEAISGIADSRYSWATVKLYYSAFYSIKSLLMMKNYSIFYIGRSPHLYKASAGEVPVKRSGNSHSVCFSVFLDVFSTEDVLSQEIDGVNPLQWIEENRNLISYRTAPYDDPAPSPLYHIAAGRIRKHLTAYMDDNSYLYSFDKDHAMIAYPVLLLKKVALEFNNIAPNTIININKHYIDILNRSGCFVPELRKNLTIFDI